MFRFIIGIFDLYLKSNDCHFESNDLDVKRNRGINGIFISQGQADSLVNTSFSIR
jgi:hypothetical protein